MLVASIVSAISFLGPSAIPMKWNIEGKDRTAIVFPGTSSGERPIIFCFHGHSGNGQIARNAFQLDTAWPEAMVVYPNGIPGIEGDRDPKGLRPGWQKDPGQLGDRDLKFFDAMLEDLSGKYKIDQSRVYACGFSNGGRMTYLLWSQRRDKLAAVAAFSSQATSGDLYQSFKPLPALVASGMKDTRVTPDIAKLSFSQVLAQNLGDKSKGKTAKGVTTYPAQPNGAETVLWAHNGAHAVPKNANKIIIPFLKRHHL